MTPEEIKNLVKDTVADAETARRELERGKSAAAEHINRVKEILSGWIKDDEYIKNT